MVIRHAARPCKEKEKKKLECTSWCMCVPSFRLRKITVKKRKMASVCEGIKRFNYEHECNTQLPWFGVMAKQLSASTPCHATKCNLACKQGNSASVSHNRTADITTALQHLALMPPEAKGSETTNIRWQSCAGVDGFSRVPSKTTWPRVRRTLICFSSFSILTFRWWFKLFNITCGCIFFFFFNKTRDSPLVENNITC